MTRFDEIIDRSNTNSVKWDFATERGRRADTIPLWVADMDFRVPEGVTAALHRLVDHGIYGYSEPQAGYFHALQQWLDRRLDWQVESAWLVKTPGVVNALAHAVRAFTQPGDAIIVQQPVYYPFMRVVKENDRTLVVNQLLETPDGYRIDFEDFEAKIVSENVRMFILCNPHNPIARVWTREELERLGDICLRHDVLVIADEIHADLILPGHRHQVFAGIKPEFRDRSVTCTAPSKTFNLAGLEASNIFIPDATLRDRFIAELGRSGVGMLNSAGIVACQAAYETGETWLAEFLEYLQGNIEFLRNYLNVKLPQIRLVEPEGTYLMWLDCRGLGLPQSELDALFSEKAGLWLNSGDLFGAGGEGFMRMNIACPRAVLGQALDRLAAAL